CIDSHDLFGQVSNYLDASDYPGVLGIDDDRCPTNNIDKEPEFRYKYVSDDDEVNCDTGSIRRNVYIFAVSDPENNGGVCNWIKSVDVIKVGGSYSACIAGPGKDHATVNGFPVGVIYNGVENGFNELFTVQAPR